MGGAYRFAADRTAVHVFDGWGQVLPVPPLVVGDEGPHLPVRLLIGQEHAFDAAHL